VAKRQRTAKTAAKQGKMSPKLISDSFLLKLSFCNAVVPHQNKKKREFGLKRLIYTEGIVPQTKMNLIFSSAFRLLCGATFFGVQLTG